MAEGASDVFAAGGTPAVTLGDGDAVDLDADQQRNLTRQQSHVAKSRALESMNGPCCTSRCARADWNKWDTRQYSTRDMELEARQGKSTDDRPPQYRTSRLERAVFRYVFADTFNGDLSLMELGGCVITIGTFFVNMFTIISVWARLMLEGSIEADGVESFYPVLVNVCVNFEFGFWMINFCMAIYKYRTCGVKHVLFKDGTKHKLRNRFARYRYVAVQCIELGELNSFSLLRLLKPYYLKFHLRTAMELSSYAKGILSPIILVLYGFAVAICAGGAFVLVLAKVALLQFVFRRRPWPWVLIPFASGSWSPADWVSFVGFVNNVARRDRSESSRVLVLEYGIIGHYIANEGIQTDAAENLICDFYEENLGEIIDKDVDSAGNKKKLTIKKRLELFAFFANLDASILFRFHEMAYGLGTVSIDGRRQLLQWLGHTDAKTQQREGQRRASKNSRNSLQPLAGAGRRGSEDSEENQLASELPEVHKAWIHVADEACEGQEMPEEAAEAGIDYTDLVLARRVAGVFDPDNTRPIEGIDEGTGIMARIGRMIQCIEGVFCCRFCCAPGVEEEKVMKQKKRRDAMSASAHGSPRSMAGSCFWTSPRHSPTGIEGPVRRVPTGVLTRPMPRGSTQHLRTIRRPRGGPALSVLQASHDVPKGVMVVRIVGCTGLSGEQQGCGPCAGIDCDAYVQLSIPNLDQPPPKFPVGTSWDRQIGRTHVAPSGCLTPSFGEAFIFPWKHTRKRPTLVLEVFDHDVGAEPDMLGWGNLQLSHDDLSRGGWTQFEVPLFEEPDSGGKPYGDDGGEELPRVDGQRPAEGIVLLEIGLPERPRRRRRHSIADEIAQRRRHLAADAAGPAAGKTPRKGQDAPPPSPAPKRDPGGTPPQRGPPPKGWHPASMLVAGGAPPAAAAPPAIPDPGAWRRCDKGHMLACYHVGEGVGESGSASHICNGCKKRRVRGVVWRCNACDFDLCRRCGAAPAAAAGGQPPLAAQLHADVPRLPSPASAWSRREYATTHDASVREMESDVCSESTGSNVESLPPDEVEEDEEISAVGLHTTDPYEWQRAHRGHSAMRLPTHRTGGTTTPGLASCRSYKSSRTATTYACETTIGEAEEDEASASASEIEPSEGTTISPAAIRAAFGARSAAARPAPPPRPAIRTNPGSNLRIH